MNDDRVYVDTSALAKWYLNEPLSEQFAAFIQQQTAPAISRLTVIELSCLLARRRRATEISRTMEARVQAAFEQDIGAGFLQVHAVADEHLVAARALISRLARHPLRTLDALHLAIAKSIGCRRLATADMIMAVAAKAIGLDVARFTGNARAKAR